MQSEELNAASASVSPRVQLDEMQRRVVELHLGESCAIVGAPGSGKTLTLLETFHDLVVRRKLADNEVLILGANRLVAADLRRQADARVPTVSGAPRVRTSSSLALSIVSNVRRIRGEAPLRLLTGAVQDELVEDSAQRRAETLSFQSALNRSVVATPLFRNQFRELLRILDDYQISDEDLVRLGEQHDVREWCDVADIVTEYRASLKQQYEHHADASTLHAVAVNLLDEIPVAPSALDTLGDAGALKVILVDDAQELTESALRLLRAFARRGVSVWAFGDPDISTGAFQGAAHRALSNLGAALDAPSRAPIVLKRVYRHSEVIRDCISAYVGHIGTAGFGSQRAAKSVEGVGGEVRFATFSTSGESAGAIAHLLRQRHLGLSSAETTETSESTEVNPVAWSDMAVLCRTRAEAKKLARQLSAAQVPTDITAGGTVLSEHALVRDLLRLTRAIFGWQTLDAETLLSVLVGPIGGVDALAVHRLATALQLADARSGEGRSAETLLLSEFFEPTADPMVDTRQGRALRSLGKTYAAGLQAREAGGDLSEVLWQLWATSSLPKTLEKQALTGVGATAESANAALDAVMALFFAVQRFEEQEVHTSREQFVDSILESALPEDSLARASVRDAVTVTTPNGMIGRAAKVVVVSQLQDGVWPNLKARGALLRLEELTQILRGEQQARPTSRQDVLHDELRMLVQALSRATSELLITAVHNDDTMPSSFFNAQAPAVTAALPSGRLTLRGLVASLRRRLNEQPDDHEAAQQLAILAKHQVPGANPREWYGMVQQSTTEPLADLADPVTTVAVSPSRLKTFEQCPLNWAISQLGGDSVVSAAAIGTLVHLALELTSDPSVDALMARIDEGWSMLRFDSLWEEQRTHQQVEEMAQGVHAYLSDFSAKGGELASAEQFFEIEIEQARVRGVIDRVELLPTDGGDGKKVLIVDLKTQRTAPTAQELAEHPQLAIYQLAVELGAVPVDSDELAGAGLLLVHPKAQGTGRYRLAVQDPLTPEQQQSLVSRILEAADGMSRSEFAANVEHHCTDPYAFGNCKLHVIRPVSHA
jgi:superfamily I DNA/RNA helicase/RecB family exonuclease